MEKDRMNIDRKGKKLEILKGYEEFDIHGGKLVRLDSSNSEVENERIAKLRSALLVGEESGIDRDISAEDHLNFFKQIFDNSDKVVFTNKSLHDLSKIWAYYSQKYSTIRSKEVCVSLADQIVKNSNDQTLGEVRDYIKSDYRMTGVNSISIFFKKSKNYSIEVIRFLYKGWDVQFN